MADIVGSLFGFSSQELMNQQRQNDQNFATNVANIYQDPGARIGALIGANLGGGLARGVFNIQDPQIKAAQDFEAALAEAQQSSSNPAEAMTKLADKLGSDPRFARQAAMAKMKAQELSQDTLLNQAKIATEQQQQAKYASEASAKDFQLESDRKAQEALLRLQEIATKEERDITSEEVINTVAPYMPVEKLSTLMQNSADKAAYRTAMLEQVKISAQARVDAAVARGDSAEQVARIKSEVDKQINELKLKTKAATSQDTPLQGREARYADNVAIAGNEAVASIQNIVSLPSTVTGGEWGSGLPKMMAGTGLFEAPIGALKNNLTPEAVQRYNTEISNIGNFYSKMLNGGLQSSVTDVQKFESQYRINEGDKPLTALTKLAQMRQTFERAAQIKANSSQRPWEKDMWQEWVQTVEKAIPITVNDINKIANARDKNKTFSQVLAETNSKQKGVSLQSKQKLTPDQEVLVGQAIEAISAGKSKDKIIQQLKTKYGIEVQ